MLHNKIRFVTANYYQLQGLRLVPFGIFLLLVAVDSQGWLEWLPGRPVEGPDDLGVVWGPLAFFVALASAHAATVRYRRRFGAVAQYARLRRNWLLGLAVVGFFVLAQVDARLEWPVSLRALLISVSLFVTVIADGWLRAHYLVGALAWLAVSTMPAYQPEPATVLLAYFGAGGLTLIVCGLGDHLLITGTLQDPVKVVDAANATAL